MPELVEWVLNGQRVKSPAGTTILEACREHGVEIPHFCYHPGLSIAGNCRMCLVETNRSPKPVISCSERIVPDLEVQTESEMAVEARNGVMEFELINHPLDCPVCDKAGECVLQDYSFDHGPDRSRFNDNKNIRHTKRLGPTIEIWGNRCIVCTRCVRFCDEISGTGELCVVERGDRSVVDVFPDIPIDNALAGNTIDICPVGALIGSDFKFEARVWFMDRTESVCAGCARGCNIEVQSLDGYLKRLVPRENREVNDWWMCDGGRYNWRYAHSDDRVRQAESAGAIVGVNEAHNAAADLVRAAREGNRRIGLLVDPFLTCEEAFLAKELVGDGASIGGWLPEQGEGAKFPGGFTISEEKAPNRTGVEAVLGREVFGTDASALQKALGAGDIDLLLVFAGFPDPPKDAAWTGAIGKAKERIAFALFPGAWSAGADVVIPAASPFEKEGTYANEDGRLQRVRASVKPGGSMPGTTSAQGEPTGVLTDHHELSALQEIGVTAGQRSRTLSAAGVFRQLAETTEPFSGLTHRDLPREGAVLPGFARAAIGGA